MKEIIKLICSIFLIMGSVDCIAQDMINYTLVANEDITDCRIVALKESKDVGKIESITGSKLKLYIHRDNAYKVTINEKKVYYLEYEAQSGFAQVDGITITKHNALAALIMSSDEAAISDPGLKYRIQIGAFAKNVSLDPLKKLGQLYTEEIYGGITRYMIGSYESNEDAAIAEARLKNMGYSSAFIVVCYNGKRISFKEASLLINEIPPSLTYN